MAMPKPLRAAALAPLILVPPGAALAQDAGLPDAEPEVVVSARMLEARSAGLADLVAEQVLQNVTIEAPAGHLETLILGSGNATRALMGINQSAGDANNQANVVTAAALPGAAIVTIDLNARQSALGNSLTTAVATDARIAESFNETSGMAQINQAAGYLNNELNALTIGFGALADPAATILNDARLSQVGGAADNALVNTGDNRPPTVVDSFNGFRGGAQVTQASGHLNQIANVAGVNVRFGSGQ